MEVYSHGGVVGFVLSGWVGLLFIIWIFSEIMSLITSRMFFIRKLFIYFRLRNKMSKMIPHWWKISHIDIITMRKTDNGFIETYIKIKSKLDSDVWTNNWLVIDKDISLIECDLFDRLKREDDRLGVNPTQLNREKMLSDLGIK